MKVKVVGCTWAKITSATSSRSASCNWSQAANIWSVGGVWNNTALQVTHRFSDLGPPYWKHLHWKGWFQFRNFLWDLVCIMHHFGHCASPHWTSFQMVLVSNSKNISQLKRLTKCANFKDHGMITLRTSRNWFLSLFSRTQGESKNWRSSRRSRTSTTKIF